MNIKKEIENLLKEALEKLEINFEGSFNLDHPQDLKNGDWTTNVALQLAGKSGKNPREFAEQIRAQIPANENIAKIEVAGPGYLNFYLSKLFFKKYLEENSNQTVWGNRVGDFEDREFHKKHWDDLDNPPKILLEHSSPNLFKPFHIGHMVNNAIGESLGRILDHQGNNVTQIAFPSDVSPGIAKTIWALKKENKSVENLTLQEIADAYVLGSAEFKEKDEVKKEVGEINDEIYRFLNGEEIKNENIDFYTKGKELSLKHFQDITKKLGSNFDLGKILFESKAEKIGKEIVKNNLGKVFKEVENEDGTKTVIFEGEQYTNVFINSQGYGTYLTKDIGLLKIKKDKYSEVQKSLVLTDVEQKQHFEMVKEAGEKIPEISDFVKKSEYLQHGRMNFSGNVKISSRYGNVPLAEDVIKKVQENILEKMKDRDFSKEEKEYISEKLAIATLKYSILKVTSGKNISFDLEKDINPQGDTATFLFYSLVRARSIYEKYDKWTEPPTITERISDAPEVERILYWFDEIVEKSVKDYSPHHLAIYLYNLAQNFNSYYAETKFLNEKNPDYKYNFALLSVFTKTLAKGLDLLGIKTVEKM